MRLAKGTVTAVVALWLGATWGWASEPLPQPSDAVLLTVSGEIGVTNTGGQAVFDRSMLRALDWQTLESFTKWTEGAQSFAGPSLAGVLQAVDARGTRIKAYALNDYSVELPISDAAEYGVLLAMENAGTPMRVRDKGPIWIIYQIKSPEAAVNAPTNHKMIWQLNRLEILP